MPNVERRIAEEILAGAGLRPSKLGLRFDRVVVGVLGELRSFTESTAPDGVTVLLTLTAPIRLASKTTQILEAEIDALIARGAGAQDRVVAAHGNQARLRLVGAGPRATPGLIGFVHNPGADPIRLLDLAERWLA